ncbi:putative heavy metal tolerance protein [Amylocarpus encephaloides]|uniref:Heavy metal tolerance protein n=1 Tax=Amylocarpus encephaloides TaxID=45428 RepID=A0A9P7YSV9_9HELO|nr:putative heavy metal tolerance protein [Amylocarpus encephaloides]
MAGEEVERSSQLRPNATTTGTGPLLDTLHFYYMVVMFVVFLVAFVVNSILTSEAPIKYEGNVRLGPGGKPLPRSARRYKEARQRREKLQDFSPGRKSLFQYLSAALLFTFIASGANIVVHALSEPNAWAGTGSAIYVLGASFFYGIIQISLFDSTPSPSIPHQITWVVSLVAEIVILAVTISFDTSQHENVNSLSMTSSITYHDLTKWEIMDICIDTARILILIFLIIFYVIFSLDRMYRSAHNTDSHDETTPLLINGHANGNGHVQGNGSIGNGAVTVPVSEDGGTTDGAQTGNGTPAGRRSLDGEIPAFYKPKKLPSVSWWEYLRGYTLFFPYLWPSRSVRLQMVVLFCIALMIMQRLVNIAVPLQIGKVTNKLSSGETGENPSMPWSSILLLIMLKFLQGNSGILGAIRSILWIPISQYAFQALATASFEHVHGLSLDFHLDKRTGEVVSALNKGNAINNFLEQITFQVLPMVVDLGVAVVYFGIAFDAYYALIVSIITFSYLYLTIRLARWRSESRRAMTNLNREEEAMKSDSLGSYETVKYFNAENYEFTRYRNAINAFQTMEYKVIVSLNTLNISQNMVFMVGLLCTSLLSAYQVTIGLREVGDFVTLLTYMAQLQQPLNFFGTFYRSVQSAMISGERLLELFKEQPTVVDDPNATPMPACEGQISFQDVKFSYDNRRPALEGLTFTCRPGTTTAFVGESGGGKSTVFRLLFRFYNAQDGSIQVDSRDIKDITVDSLRRHIGVVPQDTILFNETLMYNLKYANQDASVADVHTACKAASIHDKIMNFPDGYDTRVGERGLRLSGGEKQRVAIARTILKNPRIIMLDEATAALDTDTEQNIQEALQTLSHGRTMLVIAHRLSTITGADQIVVIHAGKVAEVGSHQDLLQMKGRYHSMWRKQIRAEQAAEKASLAVAKANRLRDALARPGSSCHEGSPTEDLSENETDTRSGTKADAPSLA